MKSLLLIILLLFTGISGWGIPDWTEDVWDQTTDAATSTWNSLSSSVSEATDETTAFFQGIANDPIISDIVSSIQSVVTLTVDAIDEAVDGFSVTAWKRIAKDAQYVIYSLPLNIQQTLAIGCNYLSELFEADIVPQPLDSLDDDDLYDLAQCLSESIYDLSVQWTKEVATTFTSIVGQHEDITSIDFSPLLNTEVVRDELNATYLCLHTIGNEISQKADNAKVSLLEQATDYFTFDNLTISIEILFTACTVTCGTASLGFAVNTADIMEHSAFYSVSLGVDSSSIVGASIGARLGFRRKFNITGAHHAIKFGVGLKLPFLPSLPNIVVAISSDEQNEGEFEGFLVQSDVIDLSLGIISIFSVGYGYTTTKWVYTTDDLKEAWNAVEDIIQDRKDTIDDVSAAYHYLTNDVLEGGAYLVKAAAETQTTLLCPSGVSQTNDENEFIGNLSVLQLGLIEIYHVVFGNVEGDNDCNSSVGYEAIRELCQYGSYCSFAADADTLGNLYCSQAADKDIDLTVIYGCPDQQDVFNLGCYTVNFHDVINKNWYQDYTHPILDDGWEKRKNALAKCARIAKDKEYPGFATYNHGMCLMAKDMFKDGVYNANGFANETTQCPVNGLGNDVSMNLYAFAKGDIAYDDLGCVNETQIDLYNEEHKKNIDKSFADFEGEHYLFQDDYKQRKNAISKCAQIAYEKEYKGFALFDGGKCVFSNYFRSDVVDGIRTLSNISNETTISCAKGLKDSYQLFQFPYVQIEEEEKMGLSAVEIVLIVACSLIAIALLCVIAYFMYKKGKCKKIKRGKTKRGKTKSRKNTKGKTKSGETKSGTNETSE